MIGLSWLGVEVTASLPSLPTMSQAHPEPNRPIAALAERVLEGGESTQIGGDRLGDCARSARRRRPAS